MEIADNTVDSTHHLEEGEVGVTHVIKCDLGVDPREVLLQTFHPVLHNANSKFDVVLVYTFVELPTEELDTHDGEHEPEHQADQQHVQDGGNGEHESVDNNLGGREKK